MLTTESFVSSPSAEAAPPLLPENGAGGLNWQRRRRRLRLYLVGSETDTQQTIDYLHTRGCIERINWYPTAIEIPENGILIQRDPDDVLRYLQRDRQLG